MNFRQQVFIKEYVRDFNATRAALAAGYSPKTAYSIGQENLKKPEISASIKAKIEELTMGADEVLLRLADIARGDISDLMALSTVGYTFELLIENEQGQRVPNPKTKLIRRIKQKVTTYLGKKEDSEDREVVETELELYSAHEALMDIAKLNGQLIDRTENVNVDASTMTVEERAERINAILEIAKKRQNEQP